MKVGDKVRFLSETGGGIVAGFQGKDIVLVEDEDGFQIPTAMTDVVVVGNEDYSSTHLVEEKAKSKGASVPKKKDDGLEEEYEPADRPISFRAPVEERKGGEMLSAYLAFVPMDAKELTTTRFETYLVNDCNYYFHFTFLSAEGNSWHVRATGEIEPNTKLFIEEFGRDLLGELEHVAVQMVAYKREKNFLLKPVVDVQMRIDGVKFYKLHTFQENDFFEQPALIHTIIENDKMPQPLVIDAKKLKEQLYSKQKADEASPARQAKREKGKNDVVVVDLHSSEILETTAGMSRADILNYQIDVFRKTLKEYENKKGQRIVFIHGKGEGILRNALVSDLRYRYKRFSYQDASFQEYGYGATLVTIK